MTLREILEDATQRTPEELKNLAQNGASMLMDFCEHIGITKDDTFNLILDLFKLFVSADRNLDESEYRLFLDFMETDSSKISAKDFYERTNHGSAPNFVAGVKELITSLPDEAREGVLYMAVAIVSCDGDIDSKEIELLEDLFD